MKNLKKNDKKTEYEVKVAGLSPKLIFFWLCRHMEDVSKNDLNEIWEEKSKVNDYYFKRIKKEGKFDHGLEVDLTHLMNEEKVVKATISSKGYDKIYGKNSMKKVIENLRSHRDQTIKDLYGGKNIKMTEKNEIKSDILVKSLQLEEVDKFGQVKNVSTIYSLRFPVNNIGK